MTPHDIEASATAAGITMKEFCDRAGVPRSVWQRWKGGRFSPQQRNYEKMANLAETLIAPTGK
jgi:transcriptional regulator with XRE-family HTH domain